MHEHDDFRLSDPVDRPNISNLLGELDTIPSPNQIEPRLRPVEPRQPTDLPRPKEDPFAAHAQELVAKAEAELDEQEREVPTLPDNPFRTGLVSFLFQGAALIRLCALSVAVNLVASLMMYWLGAQSGSAAARIGGIFLLIILTVFGMGFVFATSICCLAIVQDSANGFNKVENWPGANFMDWVGETFYIINAIVVSFLPGCFVAQMLVWAQAPVWVFGVLGGISLLLLFPPTLLSMITSSSVFAVVSLTIWKSLRTQKQTWKTFYLIVVGLSVVSFVAIWMITRPLLVLSLSGSVLLMALVMIYFRLLGRLAWVIEERIADETE